MGTGAGAGLTQFLVRACSGRLPLYERYIDQYEDCSFDSASGMHGCEPLGFVLW